MEDSFVSEIVFAQLHDKAMIVRKANLIPGSQAELSSCFNAIRDLRDYVAHANNYAETPESAGKVCRVVREILKMKKDLLEQLR